MVVDCIVVLQLLVRSGGCSKVCEWWYGAVVMVLLVRSGGCGKVGEWC